MRIAVIGAGAMGSIYGGHLSQHNDVLLVTTMELIDVITSKENLNRACKQRSSDR